MAMSIRRGMKFFFKSSLSHKPEDKNEAINQHDGKRVEVLLVISKALWRKDPRIRKHFDQEVLPMYEVMVVGEPKSKFTVWPDELYRKKDEPPQITRTVELRPAWNTPQGVHYAIPLTPGGLTKLTKEQFMNVMDSDVHAELENMKRIHPKYLGFVVFENQMMDSSNFGHRTALVVGPENTFTSFDACLGQKLGDVPSRFEHPVAYITREDYEGQNGGSNVG